MTLFDERDQLQFFKPLDRAHQTVVTPYRIGQARRAYFLEVIGKLLFHIWSFNLDFLLFERYKVGGTTQGTQTKMVWLVNFELSQCDWLISKNPALWLVEYSLASLKSCPSP